MRRIYLNRFPSLYWFTCSVGQMHLYRLPVVFYSFEQSRLHQIFSASGYFEYL